MKRCKLTKKKLTMKRSVCPICGKYHFKEINAYEICPICGWEDDPTQRKDHNYSGGANSLSLKDYKKEYEDKN